MKYAGLLLVIVLLATAQTTDTGFARQGRIGTGGELVQNCQLYFEFLGRTGAGREDTFEIDPFRKMCLLEGLDEISLTEKSDAAIADYEKKLGTDRPWMRPAA